MTDRSLPPPGFYDDSSGRTRWWDGSAWTDHTLAGRPRGIDREQRRRILDEAVAKYVRHGYTVESNDGRRAVVSKRQPITLWLNLLLTIVTAGFWLIVLAIRLANWPVDRAVLVVDDDGELQGEFSS